MTTSFFAYIVNEQLEKCRKEYRHANEEERERLTRIGNKLKELLKELLPSKVKNVLPSEQDVSWSEQVEEVFT